MRVPFPSFGRSNEKREQHGDKTSAYFHRLSWLYRWCIRFFTSIVAVDAMLSVLPEVRASDAVQVSKVCLFPIVPGSEEDYFHPVTKPADRIPGPDFEEFGYSGTDPF